MITTNRASVVTNQIAHNVITAGSVERMEEERVGSGRASRVIVVLLGVFVSKGIAITKQKKGVPFT